MAKRRKNFLVKNYSQEVADGILEIMFDAVCSRRDYLIVAGDEIHHAVVKSRLLKLDCRHIEYVLYCLKKIQIIDIPISPCKNILFSVVGFPKAYKNYRGRICYNRVSYKSSVEMKYSLLLTAVWNR